MNRRGFFQTIVAGISVTLAFFTQSRAKVKQTTHKRSTLGVVWVTSTFTTIRGKPGNMTCPFCNNTIAKIEEGGLYPITLYCRKCKIGFNKFEDVRFVEEKMEVEYTYES